MSSYMFALVEDAAGFLDVHGPAGWRDLIVPDKLDMASPTYDILGQIYGEYDKGTDILGAFAGFRDIEEAFTGWHATSKADAWKEYLMDHKNAYDNVEWNDKECGEVCCQTTSKGTVVVDGDTYVVHKSAEYNSALFLWKEDKFLSNYTRKPILPTYEEGRLYHSADKSLVFMYTSSQGYNRTPGFLRLNSNGRGFGSTGYDCVEFYEETFGPLEPVTVIDGAPTGPRHSVTAKLTRSPQ